MTKKLLYLLYGHPLVNGHRSQRSAEFMGMDLVEVQLAANFTKPYFNSADLQSVIWFKQRHK